MALPSPGPKWYRSKVTQSPTPATAATMHIHRIDSHQTESLADFFDSRLRSFTAGRRDISIDLDIDADLTLPTDPSWLQSLCQSLIDAAIREMPTGGNILLTACRCGDHIELEIADDGSSLPDRFRHRPLVAAKMGATLHWQDCPQGGVAVTVRFAAQAQSQSRDAPAARTARYTRAA